MFNKKYLSFAVTISMYCCFNDILLFYILYYLPLYLYSIICIEEHLSNFYMKLPVILVIRALAAI